LRFRLLPCGVRWSRRTARSYQLRAIPLRRCSQPRHPRQEVGSPMRFLAPRVSGAIHNCVRWRRRRADHSWPISFGRRTGSAPAVIATWPGSSKSRRRPWDSLLHPSQFCFRPRVTASFDVSHPPAVSPLAAASFIVAGSHRLWRCDRRFVAAAPGVWPRERTVPCDLAAPPWLLRTGPIEIHQPILPWAFHLFNEVCLRRSFLRYRQGTVTTT